ncbi:integrin alpha-PS3-like [Macrobrachium nipponense]|uniref:integrin alpha-PS3-like n=1 Tax=Macrobrachium nipponense TaxID=159736 RepID=UPI0030C7ED16
MPRSRGLFGSAVLPFPASWAAVWLKALVWLTISTATSAFNLEPESAQIFSDPTAGTGRESYFGFSVALQKNALDNSNWLVVGAPRANSSSYKPTVVMEPGAIFKCNLQNDTIPCQELRIDQAGICSTVNWRYLGCLEHMDFGWLGSSLDSQPSRKDNRQATATCAPRWKNRLDKLSQINGACYWLNASLQDSPAHKFLPLKDVFHEDDRYYYSMGQAGMSVHFPDNQKEMIIGAPGLHYWEGGVILMRDDTIVPFYPLRRPTLSENRMFTSALVPDQEPSLSYYDLSGYAVTSGRFFDKDQLLYVTGAPRGAEMHGKVLIFSFSTYKSLNIWTKYKGSQLGENFGAALIAADVNGDGLSDLIVGSPTYSEPDKPDVGRIQVFTGKIDNTIEKISSHSGSGKTFARFGTTLAPSGDINQDRYEDVAVGAPWEDDGRGAVYIYLGSISGLRKEFSQRLTPEDFPSHPLRGFGMSMSRGIDTDDNGYPDLAIGSFISGHALVLRSRTVASLSGHWKSNPPALELDTTEFTLTACITYNGYRVPTSVDVSTLLTLDYGYHAPRASFLDIKRPQRNVTLTSIKGRETCETFQVSAQSNNVDPKTPITVKFEYRIPDFPGNQLYQPKTDNTEPQSFTNHIRILTDCEDNGNSVCETDLHVEAEFINFREEDYLVIGGTKQPEMKISVRNTGESVFLPNVSISVPKPFVLFLPTSHNCEFSSKDDRSHLVCQLKNPIQKENEDAISVLIDPRQVTDAISSTLLTVNVEAAGEGIELDAQDNHQSSKIQLLAEAKLKLQGYSRDEQILYHRLDEDTINTNKPKASFTHYYSVSLESHGSKAFLIHSTLTNCMDLYDE